MSFVGEPGRPPRLATDSQALAMTEEAATASMVRRASPVRVRKRALQKPRSRGFFFRIELHVVERGAGMEPFMEPSGRKTPSATALWAFAMRPGAGASCSDG